LPVRIYFVLLGGFPVDSREYTVLKTSILESVPPGDYNIEILCDVPDTELLLEHAKRFCPECVPHIEKAILSVRAPHAEN